MKVDRRAWAQYLVDFPLLAFCGCTAARSFAFPVSSGSFVASPMLLRGFSKTKLFYVAAPIHQSQPCGRRSYEVQFAAIHQESCSSEISKCGTSFCMVGAVLGTPSLSGFCKK